MKNFLFQGQWNWKASGIALAFSFFLAVLLVKPIGISTQFVILDGIVWNSISSDLIVKNEENKSGYASSNAYFNKSSGKYAKHIAQPMNYSFIFVLAMILGGFLGKITTNSNSTENNNERETQTNEVSSSPYDKLTKKRLLLTFIGGFLVLLGARLAGGCTSGHMMSGMMQTSLSGYLFAMSAFAVAIPTAILLYGKDKEEE